MSLRDAYELLRAALELEAAQRFEDALQAKRRALRLLRNNVAVTEARLPIQWRYETGHPQAVLPDGTLVEGCTCRPREATRCVDGEGRPVPTGWALVKT